MKTKLTIAFLVSLACATVTSCGTINGLGQDLSNMGRSIKHKVQHGTWGSSAPAHPTPVVPSYGATDYGPADYPPPR